MGHTKEKKTERVPDPILTPRFARLEAKKVMEHPAVVKNDKPYAPRVSIWWEIVDDKSGGDHNGTRFWDNYSFVKSYDDDTKYVIREGTRIGDLAAFMAYEFSNGANYFDSDVEVDFEDLDREQVVASLEPRRFKEGEPPTGTRTVSTTLQLAERAEKVASSASLHEYQEEAARTAVEAEEDEDFEDPRSKPAQRKEPP
jgi:hypothetical protein